MKPFAWLLLLIIPVVFTVIYVIQHFCTNVPQTNANQIQVQDPPSVVNSTVRRGRLSYSEHNSVSNRNGNEEFITINTTHGLGTLITEGSGGVIDGVGYGVGDTTLEFDSLASNGYRLSDEISQ